MMADNFLSLSPGTRKEITVPFDSIWTSSDVGVVVKNGWVYTRKTTGSALITATEKAPGIQVVTFQITIVPSWNANRVELEVDKDYGKVYIINEKDGVLYASIQTTGLELFTSTDGMQTLTKVSDLPDAQRLSPILITPNGYFLKTGTSVYYSKDLASWLKVVDITYNGLKHAFDYYHDIVTGKTYVYAGEYSTVSTHRCRVYRGVVEPDGSQTWSVALEFISRDEYIANPNLSPVCWHIHVVTVDKATGDVYVGTGDDGNECAIRKSTNNGDTWEIVGIGTQDWRTLSIWFTDSYMYWNMDSSSTQSVWRMKKGTTKKELVVTLGCGSQWYHLWVKDDNGDDVVLMSTAPEGSRLDDHGRLFFIKENSNKTVEVEEVLLDPRIDGEDYFWARQIEPYAQDQNGYLYANSRTANSTNTTKCYKIARCGLQSLQMLYMFPPPVFI